MPLLDNTGDSGSALAFSISLVDKCETCTPQHWLVARNEPLQPVTFIHQRVISVSLNLFHDLERFLSTSLILADRGRGRASEYITAPLRHNAAPSSTAIPVSLRRTAPSSAAPMRSLLLCLLLLGESRVKTLA